MHARFPLGSIIENIAKMPAGRQRKPKAGRTPSIGRVSPTAISPSVSETFLVVGVGASAGGLDACKHLLGALPPGHGMAFILIQHLDPTHESMMVGLLSANTSMPVCEAVEGMRIEPDHLYVIPPGTYLSVGKGVLHLSQPQARHGSRLPFDFLLHSLAAAYQTRAACVVLSGTGADGSLGLRTIREKHGLVVAQNPDEAEYNGMPQSAILTGAVDLVRPVAEIPAALIGYANRLTHDQSQATDTTAPDMPDWLPEIIDLLKTKTTHNFTLYKQGTLKRRIERRMAMAAIEVANMDRYLDILRSDNVELELLAKDLLINVTSFFRDPEVFDYLETKILPDLIRDHPHDQALRIWIAGCSTGEETYSLAILLQEQITAAQRNIKLQVFASDVDPDAVASAREGFYPETIEAEVSPARLERFFTKEDRGYRVLPDLRAHVVFTIQDVLADPPFSRLDLISCRNLLIYLLPEAQSKIVSLFHFALRDSGILLLGNSETIGNADDRFEVISKSGRLYRHIGRRRQGEFGFSAAMGDGMRTPKRKLLGPVGSRQVALADLCRRLVTEAYAPASILINRKYECLYNMGPTDTYLKVAAGHPASDLLAMARDGVRTKLRAALQRADQENTRILVPGGKIKHDGRNISFTVAAQPVTSEGEEFFLVCFIEDVKTGRSRQPSAAPPTESLITEIEQELQSTRMELQGAIRNLEISSEEQKAINEEALSVNEEFQSTNEELLTSKEELQSLNEELTALNSQLQETLERQRMTSNDLQNILYSTDVATLFLDIDLNIRFFTPTTKMLFNVIPSDVGRPLADLSSLVADDNLLTDAQTVLNTLAPIEREIESERGAWYIRRILPYRTQNSGVEGVVITFVNDTERRHAAEALEAAERKAQQANIVKSRFLAAASHDLRQPLQTLVLLQGLLAKSLRGGKAQEIADQIDGTLDVMTAMLNTLLDIDQIETGTVRPEIDDFVIGDLLERLHHEFSYNAQAKMLTLGLARCSLSIRSDPRLLEQMIRNLLSNALKYTKEGKVLLGCRRHGMTLSIEVWDTGIGIPDEERDAIFDEYHQIDNSARERSRGLGLGLSIVQRLGVLLDHRILVRSSPGKGSTFSIEVPLSSHNREPNNARNLDIVADHGTDETAQSGAILIVEDDPEVSDALILFLKEEGHRTATASDGLAALKLIRHGAFRPDLILADYNLPNGMNGQQLILAVRETLRRDVSALILTGDMTPELQNSAVASNYTLIKKPVKLSALSRSIQAILRQSAPLKESSASVEILGDEDRRSSVIYVVDDDSRLRAAIKYILEDEGFTVEDYVDGETFLAAYRPGGAGCLLIDATLPGMNGLEVLGRLNDRNERLPAIMITGNGDVSMAVQAMKAGVSDFIEKPVGPAELIASVERALERSLGSDKLNATRETAARHIAGLTGRQRQILDMVLAGQPSKNIAVDLHISQRTVENHRAAIMKKMGAKSLPALARLALAATWNGSDEPKR